MPSLFISSFDSLKIFENQYPLSSLSESKSSSASSQLITPTPEDGDFYATLDAELATLRFTILNEHKELVATLISKIHQLKSADFIRDLERINSTSVRTILSGEHEDLKSKLKRMNDRDAKNHLTFDFEPDLDSYLSEESNFTDSRIDQPPFYTLWIRYRYLLDLRQRFTRALSETEYHFQMPAILDTAKKMADSLDDIYSFFRGDSNSPLLNIIGPIIVGLAGGIIHFAEGVEGGMMGWDAYNSPDSIGRRPKIITGITIVATTGAGFGLSVSYLAAILGASVSGAAFMPFIIPALLTTVYGMAQWRRIQIRREAKEIYEQFLQPPLEQAKQLEQKHPLSEHQITLGNLYKDVAKVSQKSCEKVPLDSKDLEILAQYETLKTFAKMNYAGASRAVNFGYVEVFASTLTAIGTALSMSAIIAAVIGAAGVASAIAILGGIPTALLAVGVTIGIGSKIYEKNDKSINKRALAIWDTVKSAGSWLKQCFKQDLSPPLPKPTPSPTRIALGMTTAFTLQSLPTPDRHLELTAAPARSTEQTALASEAASNPTAALALSQSHAALIPSFSREKIKRSLSDIPQTGVMTLAPTSP